MALLSVWFCYLKFRYSFTLIFLKLLMQFLFTYQCVNIIYSVYSMTILMLNLSKVLYTKIYQPCHTNLEHVFLSQVHWQFLQCWEVWLHTKVPAKPYWSYKIENILFRKSICYWKFSQSGYSFLHLASDPYSSYS